MAQATRSLYPHGDPEKFLASDQPSSICSGHWEVNKQTENFSLSTLNIFKRSIAHTHIWYIWSGEMHSNFTKYSFNGYQECHCKPTPSPTIILSNRCSQHPPNLTVSLICSCVRYVEVTLILKTGKHPWTWETETGSKLSFILFFLHKIKLNFHAYNPTNTLGNFEEMLIFNVLTKLHS